MPRSYSEIQQEVYGTSLITDLTGYKAELQSIAVELGMPQYRSIVIRKAIPSTAEDALDGEEVLQDYLLIPPCYTTRAPTSYAGMALSEDTVVQPSTDLMVKNLPRTFSRKFLSSKIQAYILDPVFDAQGIVTGGVYCQLKDVLDDRTLSWRLILRMKPDKEKTTTTTPAVRITKDA